MKRPSLTKTWCWMAALAALLSLYPLPDVLAQDQTPPPQGTSRGENFSAKPPAQLFATDCTGAGCHKGPQGLGKGQFPGALAGFLREHYTNSRESAAALAGYLSKIPSGPEPREARTPRSGRTGATAAAPASGTPNWGGEGAESKPTPPNEVRGGRQHPAGRASRAAVRPDDEPAATPPAPPVAAPPAAEPNPSGRAQRGRQPVTAAAPPPPPPPEPEPAPAAPPPPPAPKQFDIFD